MSLSRAVIAVAEEMSLMPKVTRRPRFPETVPVLGDLSPVKAVLENVPDFDTEWGKMRADSK